MSTNYLGFAENSEGQLFGVWGASSDAPERLMPLQAADLTNTERAALSLDTSPALYHWNDLLFLNSSGQLQTVYARGKDFIPFSGLDHVRQLKQRRVKPSLGPASIQIQPYQMCNDDCSFCCTVLYREREIYKGKRFSKEQWLQLLRWHADNGGEVVEIIGGGEPTMHPDFVAVLHEIPKLGLKAYLFTNGSRFSKRNGTLNYPLLDAIVAGCMIVTVSLDGYENRHRVHRKLNWQTTMGTFRGMDYIHSQRDRSRTAFYNSYILTGGNTQASNVEDLYPCVERQAGWVDSIHVQNDFMSLSHTELCVDAVQQQLQRTIDAFFKSTYLYFNYPLITRFNLRVPYQLSVHNTPSSEFNNCLRSWLAPTVECGSFKIWPCGKYAGEALPEHQRTFESIPLQLAQMRESSDHKNGISCASCINSSYNASLSQIQTLMEQDIEGQFFHFYEANYVRATMEFGATVSL